MLTRLVEYADGTFNGEWSEDNGKTWHKEVHRKMFMKKLAERYIKGAYPKARFIGTVQESSL